MSDRFCEALHGVFEGENMHLCLAAAFGGCRLEV